MKKRDMMRYLFGAVVLCGMLSGACTMFNDDDGGDDGPVSIEFSEEVIAVTAGGQVTVGVRIQPRSALTEYEVEYTIGNEDFAIIYRGTKTEVVISGKSAGSTVLRGMIADAEAVALVQVKALEEEEEEEEEEQGGEL
jgi:hypothetical protein